ncbi:MAG: hypothetical protein A3G76_01205 [Acidobacteria bacterium RIFCSPLOWO2_12_FULL_65_11]|nr:MAG: hypothetical protein A3H95_14990 [Acidobacteria bacterium RIFCSPLOWO2_02_FULL_64_15]OFW32518.1 MAG: hypothetical protein A3G76_01205 [Acidobacteria bacterium RIFCSPLOWO2_12_FULL_65_11]
MVNRREFIQTGAAAVVVTGIGIDSGAAAPAHAPEAPVRRPLYKAIYDERYRDSVAFAEQARRLGLATQAIAGDVTGLWFKDLDLRWREDKVPIVGLTTDAALFCLEQFAHTRQMRVVYRAEHAFEPGRVVHTFECAPSGFDHLTAFERDGLTDWAPRVARLELQPPGASGAALAK